MKLYAIVGSPNSRKVLAVVSHLGLDIEIIYLDLFNGDQFNPDYTALNPNAMVPTLVDGDFILWESNAINQYLTDKAEHPTLYPRDLKQRADVNRWLAWELAHFNQALGTIVFECVARPQFFQQEGDPALIRSAQENLKKYAAVLERHLENRHFMVGNHLTIANYAIIHGELFKDVIPFNWSPFPHINKYFDRIKQSEHWAATMPSSPDLIGRIPLDQPEI